jgi:leucyl aminopeptidase (aminopeptidase T)
METLWQPIAQRIVQGLGVTAGELIQVRDSAGRLDALLEILLAIECAGATPLPQITPAAYLQRLWSAAPRGYLADWDRHRQEWVRRFDRVLVLGGISADFSASDEAAFSVWRQAVHRLSAIEEARGLPVLVVALPTEARAAQLGMSLSALEQIVLPALAASGAQLTATIRRVQDAVADCRTLIVQTGGQHELRLERGQRPWLCDDGVIDDADRARGGGVSNLPAGSIYTTVLEHATQGRLWLPQAGDARDVVLSFEAGRIAQITAQHVETLHALFARHTGEPRRVGHIGIGLNPHLDRLIGWTLVDEHVEGCLFISLGENRYMGGQNESSLNVDYAIPAATLIADGRVIVAAGKLVV